MSYHQHHFNVDIAKKFGIDVAIFLDHMVYWIQKNMGNNKHFHDGTWWTRNTIEAYRVIFPYWSTMQVRKVLRDCKKYGLINTGNYNDRKYDRAGWYSLTEYAANLLNITICSKQQMEEAKTTNAWGQKNTPIPITNTITNIERAARKKRVPLPDDFNPDEKGMALAVETARKCNTTVSYLVSQFMKVMRANGKKACDWQLELDIFLGREKPQIIKKSGDRDNERKDTTPWFNDNH